MIEPRPYDDAGCCPRAVGVITFMPAASHRYPHDPAIPSWCIVSDLGSWPIEFCPFCATPVARIPPRRTI